MKIPKIIQDIYDVFKDYYGESFVDLQPHSKSGDEDITVYNGFDILVYWSEVIVTNEYDEHITIWKLFNKTVVDNTGKLMVNPLFNRSEYNKIQWDSDYAHSHICGINKSRLSGFRGSCLGSGPINHTIAKLKASSLYTYEPDCVHHDYTREHLYLDMEIWQLYCWELDKYVHIESIAGGPYRKIKNVGNQGIFADRVTEFHINICKFTDCEYLYSSFIKHILSKNLLKYSYYNGSYNLSTNFIDTVVTLSDEFISWYNSNPNIQEVYNSKGLINRGIIKKAIIGNNYIICKKSINSNSRRSDDLLDNIGHVMFKFKGKDITLTYNGINSIPKDDTYILNLDFLGLILYRILRYLNVNYGKSTETTINKKSRIF